MTQILAPKVPINARRTFAINMEAKSPYTRPGSSVKSFGHGFRLWIIKAERRTAAVEDPGIPRVRRGTMAPPTDPEY